MVLTSPRKQQNQPSRSASTIQQRAVTFVDSRCWHGWSGRKSTPYPACAACTILKTSTEVVPDSIPDTVERPPYTLWLGSTDKGGTKIVSLVHTLVTTVQMRVFGDVPGLGPGERDCVFQQLLSEEAVLPLVHRDQEHIAFTYFPAYLLYHSCPKKGQIAAITRPTRTDRNFQPDSRSHYP